MSLFDWNQKDITQGKEVITVIDAHTAGEPLRIVTSGMPDLPGNTILERRRYMQENLDYIRLGLMHEPRGHYDMYGCIVTPPVTEDADLGVLFTHNEGYSTMCGHGIIAVVTTLIETGAIKLAGTETKINIDTPAGLVRATAHTDSAGNVLEVSFLNVPSFLYQRDITLNLPGLGEVMMDIAFGGAFYAVLPASRVGIHVLPENSSQLVQIAETIKQIYNSTHKIEHPEAEDLSFLYGTIFTDTPEDPDHHSRNLCVFANAEVDRSPTGTGVSSRLALHYAKDELKLNQSVVIESILGKLSWMRGRVTEETTFGSHAAVIPEVAGKAYITGINQLILDPSDQLGKGFLIEP